MQVNRCIKKYIWEVRKFNQCDSTAYKQMKQSTQTLLYLYKQSHPQVIVRLINPTQKIHCWVFTQVQILQKLNDNPCVSHWKSVTFPFKGQLILSLLPNFNQKLNQQILESIPKRMNGLQKWMQAEIVDVFAVATRSQQSFGNEHAFFQIKTIYRTRYINYFQTRAWKSKVWEGLLQIAESQNIKKNSSFSILLDEINCFINSFQVIKDQKYNTMFDIHVNRKTSKRVPPKDQFQQNYERKILQKYKLYQYI